MIYTVTFNPSLDYIVKVENFRTGMVNRTTEEKIFPGGKGINVSIVLHNLGYDSLVLGFCGGFTGDKLMRLLEERGLYQELIQVENGMTRINVKLRSKEETEINGQGPVIEEADLERLFEKLRKLENGDFLVLAGSIPATIPKTIYRDIMDELKGKNLKIVVDATKELLINVLPCGPFLIKPNHHELGEIFNVSISNKEDVIIYGKRLQEMGAKNVLVSMAEKGAVLITERGEIYQSEAPKGEVKNSVGAGDSMVAGFLAGYLQHESYQDAFEMGLCAGSASAFSEGLAEKEQITELLKRELLKNSCVP